MKKNINFKITTFLLISLLLIPSLVSAESSNTRFSDIRENNWFYDSVMELTKKGSIKGYSDNTFRPNDDISFAEFLKLAVTSTTNKEFKAKEGEHWAMGVYREAIFRSVIDPTNFRPNKETFNSPITREEMTYILIGVNENIQKEAGFTSPDVKLDIKDMDKVDENNRISVVQAYKKGLINGKNGYFQPDSNTSRAEAATVIVRLLDKSKRIK